MGRNGSVIGITAWPLVQLSLQCKALKHRDTFAASQPFLDIAMPPYQDRNDRNKRNKNIKKVAKRDPLFIDGQAPRPMYVDYKDLDLLTKLTNRHGRIVSRRKTGCHAASQHAVARAIKRARFMALLPYVGD
jgi:small subunit ribosomal protein S18